MVKQVHYKGNTYTIEYDIIKEKGIFGSTICNMLLTKVNDDAIRWKQIQIIRRLEIDMDLINITQEYLDEYISINSKPKGKIEEFEEWDGNLDNYK